MSLARKPRKRRHNTDEHVERIADMMARGAWLTGISARQYAKDHNAVLSTVKNWSSQAHRIVNSATSEERREMVVTTLAKLEVIAARATADKDWRGGVAALTLLAKIAGLEAPTQMHVKVVPPDAPDGVRELLERALDRSLRRETPPPKVLTDGANGHVDAKELLDGEHHCATIPQRKLKLKLGGIRADDLQAQLLLLNQRQSSSRAMAPTTLPALDDGVEVVSLGAPRPFQNGPNMNPTHFSNVRPCVALLAQYKCLATNVFQGFGRKLAGIDLFHARIISKPI